VQGIGHEIAFVLLPQPFLQAPLVVEIAEELLQVAESRQIGLDRRPQNGAKILGKVPGILDSRPQSMQRPTPVIAGALAQSIEKSPPPLEDLGNGIVTGVLEALNDQARCILSQPPEPIAPLRPVHPPSKRPACRVPVLRGGEHHQPPLPIVLQARADQQNPQEMPAHIGISHVTATLRDLAQRDGAASTFPRRELALEISQSGPEAARRHTRIMNGAGSLVSRQYRQRVIQGLHELRKPVGEPIGQPPGKALGNELPISGRVDWPLAIDRHAPGNSRAPWR
jgi:hypothetical protein